MLRLIRVSIALRRREVHKNTTVTKTPYAPPFWKFPKYQSIGKNNHKLMQLGLEILEYYQKEYKTSG